MEDDKDKKVHISEQKAEGNINNYFYRTKPRLENTNTIIRLLEYLSNDKNYITWNRGYICDPQAKLENKLKEHASLFKEEYFDLLPAYGGSTEEAKKMIIQEGIRAEKIAKFLRRISNEYLERQHNNPKIAFDKLCEFFENEIKEQEKVDEDAIRFYLLDELIGCNIFSEEIK